MTTVGHAVSAPGLAAGIWPRTTRLEPGGEISVGGVSLGDLAARYGTPAYIVAEADVRYRCQAYREAFPAAEIAYAGKAFMSRAMIRWIDQEGLALDVCSAGELAVARAVSFPARRILLHGNAKTPGDLHAAIDDESYSLQPLLDLYERDESAGVDDLPYPPDYPKMPGEPKRVQPSRDRDRPQ